MTRSPGPLTGTTVLDLSTVGPAARCTPRAGRLRRPGGQGRPAAQGGGDAARATVPRVQRPARHGPDRDRPQGAGRSGRVPPARGAAPTWWSRASGPGSSTGWASATPRSRAANPGIVYCSTSGYGQSGPHAARAGHDLNYLAVGGYLHMSGRDRRRPAAAARRHGGRHRRGRACRRRSPSSPRWSAGPATGDGRPPRRRRGRRRAGLLSLYVDEYLATGAEPGPGHYVLTGRYACYDVYGTADGGWLAVAAIEPRFWANLCRALGLERWIDHQTDDAVQDAIRADLRRVLAGRPRDEWVALLADADTCVAPVLSVPEVVAEPQFAARGLFVEAVHPAEAAVPPARPGVRRRPGPPAGPTLPDPAETATAAAAGRGRPGRRRDRGAGRRGGDRVNTRRARGGGRLGRRDPLPRDRRVPGRAGLHLDVLRLGRERQPAVLGRRGGRRSSPAGRSRRRPCCRCGSGPTTGSRAPVAAKLPLQVHFDLKERLGLPEAIMSDSDGRLPRPGAPGRRDQHPPGAAVAQRAQDDPARHRAVLGDRRRRTATRTASWSASRRSPASATTWRAEGNPPPPLPPIWRRLPAALILSADRQSRIVRRRGNRRSRSPRAPHGGSRRLVRQGGRRRRAAPARLRRDRHDRRARRARHPGLAADAPRPRLRRRPQRRPGHLPQHAQPAGLVRAFRHRLDRSPRPARTPALPHARLGLPRRHDGARPAPCPRRPPTPPAAAGRPWPSSYGPAAGCAAPPACASPCRSPPTTTRGAASASAGPPRSRRCWTSPSPTSRRCCAHMVRGLCAEHAPPSRRAGDGGRPGRLPGRPVDAVRRARPVRPAGARPSTAAPG